MLYHIRHNDDYSITVETSHQGERVLGCNMEYQFNMQCYENYSANFMFSTVRYHAKIPDLPLKLATPVKQRCDSQFLASLRFQVLRVPNQEVLSNQPGAMKEFTLPLQKLKFVRSYSMRHLETDT